MKSATLPPRMFKALPPYFGGKRRMVQQIFRLAPPPAEAPVFVDAFLGGGSVAYVAKARGYRVLANDIADRSVLIGKALIENNRVRISEEDIRRLFVPHPANDRFVERTFPEFFLARHVKVIDNALAHARSTPDPVKRSLLLLLVVHFILRWRPFGDFHQPGALKKLEQGEYDGINARLFRGRWGTLFNHTCLEKLRLIARDLNTGVFSNGLTNEMHQSDVLDFLDRVEGDVLYLDPPYYGSNSYERVYDVLDQILAGEVSEYCASRFNHKDADSALLALLEKASRFSTWILSFGGGKIGGDECLRMVGRFRKAEIVPVRHRYSYARPDGDRAAGREILIVGRAA